MNILNSNKPNVILSVLKRTGKPVALNEQQQKLYDHLTINYEKAILATRKQLLTTVTNPDDLYNELLNANLTLNFMIANHKKYIKFLNFLHDRKGKHLDS